MAKKKLPKKPRKPRASASETVLKNYLGRHNEWKKKVNEIKNAEKRRETLVKKISGLK